jgi:osmotically-inducible protein OsmY
MNPTLPAMVNRLFAQGPQVPMAAIACLAVLASPQTQAQGGGSLKTIVVTGKKTSDAADAEVKQHLEAAMHSSPFFYDGHITVTVKDGVVKLQGMVFDDWDLRVAKRIATKIPGVKRVDNDLEIEQGGD